MTSILYAKESIEVLSDERRGHVFFGEQRFGAALRLINNRLRLEVSDPEGHFRDVIPDKLDLIHFRTNSSYFSLLHLRRISSKTRLGVGGMSMFSVSFALEEALFPALDDVRSDCWCVYVEDVAKIHHVTGLQHSIMLLPDNRIALNWAFNPAKPIELDCSEAKLIVELGQDMKTNGDLVGGPSLAFKYPVKLRFETPVDLDTALKKMNRVRQFFSLLMGRMLGINEAYLRLIEDGRPHDVGIHGLRATQLSDKPANRIVSFDDPVELAALLDRWLVRADGLADAVSLHFQGLEQRDLEPSLRFQLFVQAIEAVHRRTAPLSASPIAAVPILDTLRTAGISDDVVDRVGGVLAHAHEPGLRQRLKYYWELFAAEIKVLRPGLKQKAAISQLAATRNFYAHRTDKTSQILEGADLWDATELMKAISHMAILREIEAQTVGIGQSMLDNMFVQFAERTDRIPAGE